MDFAGVSLIGAEVDPRGGDAAPRTGESRLPKELGLRRSRSALRPVEHESRDVEHAVVHERVELRGPERPADRS